MVTTNGRPFVLPVHSSPHFNRLGYCACGCDACGRWKEFCHCLDCPCDGPAPQLHGALPEGDPR